MKVTLNHVGSLIDATTAATTINADLDTISTAIDNTLSRDGTSPNQMENSLDMNSNDIINLPAPATPFSPLRLQDLSTFIGGGTITAFPTGGSTGQALLKTSGSDFAMNWGNTVSSVALALPADFTISNSPVTTTGTLTGSWATTPSGTGAVVRATSPTLVTPTLGAATATSINKVTITAPVSSSTITVSNGATLTVPSNATVSGTNTGDQTSVVSVRLQKFIANGTYTPSTGMMYCVIECLGGGGAGGSVAGLNTNAQAGAGGGSGGYSRMNASAATIGASQAVTIGAAGAAAAAGNNAGGNGGDTSVGTICIGKGGTGGGGSSGNTATGGAGGIAGTGTFNTIGHTGFNSVALATSSFNYTGGPGGSSHFGSGGTPPVVGSAASSDGVAGIGFGSGGSGGAANGVTVSKAGGAGSAGVVFITEFCST